MTFHVPSHRASALKGSPGLEHTVHVPVMGTGFTIDTPIRLAPWGFHSAISLVNDSLVEIAREEWCLATGRAFEAIGEREPDKRARRIKVYLDLVQDLVDERTADLRNQPLLRDSDAARYFRLLPDDSPLKERFERLIASAQPDPEEERALRDSIRPGRVDVNIMTKLDAQYDRRGQLLPERHSEALAAARGFLESKARGGLVLSAGANPRLFAELGNWDCLLPDAEGMLEKELILKVSDFRSALVQGKMLARRGVWVSEYRIESGLNCGGHAFPTEGQLLGGILEEFRDRRRELDEGLFASFDKGLKTRGVTGLQGPPPVRVTVQGGLGTAREDLLVRDFYRVDGTGWGSPFLLVPEAVRLDDETAKLLVEAKDGDIMLSRASPLGVRLWNLRTSPSERSRRDRIAQGYPGSVCKKGHLALNTDYGTVPLCAGSRAYQKRRLAELDPEDPNYELLFERITAPACICEDLGGAFQGTCLEAKPKQEPPSAICPGPNLVNFQHEMSLDALIDHIYGRANALSRIDRPHFLLREAELYLDVAEDEMKLLGTPLQGRNEKKLEQFLDNCEQGLSRYRELFLDSPMPYLEDQEVEEFRAKLEQLVARLTALRARLQSDESTVTRPVAVGAP